MNNFLKKQTYVLFLLFITGVFSQDGLKGVKYQGYYADNLDFFNTATTQADAIFDNNLFTAINTTTPGQDLDETYSVRFYGYFTATETSTHTFYTESDDASMLWIGNAQETFSALETRRTVGNAIVDNSGTHGLEERSGSIALVIGESYPIVVYFGEYSGGDQITVSFSALGIDKTNNGIHHYSQNIKIAPTVTDFNNYTKTYFDRSFTISDPTSNSSGAFSYTSDNTAVATISGNTVTITGAGVTNIIASQAADATYSVFSSTVTLNISSVLVVDKYGRISNTSVHYINKYGAIGANSAIGIGGNSVIVKTDKTNGLGL